MATIREAFEYAAKNPNSDFAKNLSQLAASGSLDVEAKKNGIDLTPFKPVQKTTENIYSTGETKYDTNSQKVAGDLVGVTKLAEGIGQTLAASQTAKALEQSVNTASVSHWRII